MSDRTAAAATRPNIVLILVDDMGYSDIGCFGSEIRTPHLDALAAGGVRLTQMYNGARCCPTRASLLTGLYAHQAGIGHMVRDLGAPRLPGLPQRRAASPSPRPCARPATAPSCPASGTSAGSGRTDPEQIRRDAGQPGFPTPLQRGFDRFFGTLAGAGSYFNPHTLMREGGVRGRHRPPRAVGRGRDGGRLLLHRRHRALRRAGRSARGGGGRGAVLPLRRLHRPPLAPARPAGGHGPLPRALPGGLGRPAAASATPASRSWASSRRTGPSPRATPQAPDWDGLSPERRDWEDARMAVYAAQVEAHGPQRRAHRGRPCGRRAAASNTLILFLSDNGGCAEFLREDGAHGSAPPLTRDGRPDARWATGRGCSPARRTPT